MKFDYKYLIILILNLFVWGTNAQDLPKVEAQVDTTQIRIGEQIRLKLRVKTDTLSFADFPEMENLGDFEVVKSSKVDTLQAKPVRELQKEYFLTKWDSGQYVLPSVRLSVNDSVLQTDSIPNIKVLGVKVDTVAQPAYGFKNIIDVEGKDASGKKSTKGNYWWLLPILLILGALSYYFYRKRKEVKSLAKKLSPYEQALNQWKKLDNEKLWLKDKTDVHYLELSLLLKNFIENELHLSAKEKISSELLQDLKKYRFEDGSYIHPDLLQRMAVMLKRADLAKYAKSQPDATEIDLDMQTIKDFIDSTHEVVQRIADEKAQLEAEKLAAKKRKRRLAYYTIGSIAALIILLGGVSYYFLNKYGILQQVKQNIQSPEWLYNEYGANPAIGMTTPHILHPVDFMNKLSDKEKSQMKKIMDEMSVYADENFIKGYGIIEMNMDFKSLGNAQGKGGLNTKQMNSYMMNMIMQFLKAEDVQMNKDELAEGGERYYGSMKINIPKLNVKREMEFDSRFYNGNNYIRMIYGVHTKGNKENKELIDRVLSSIELIKD